MAKVGLAGWMLVAAGGALGTLGRAGLAALGAKLAPESWWPLGTFLANALGSFLLAFVFVWGEGRSLFGTELRLVLGTGVLGAFTTYSTYNLEALRLLADGQLFRGGVYLGATLATCLGAGAMGLALGRALAG
ncbi:MAG: CrcB family protein [Myxococcota bacterium]